MHHFSIDLLAALLAVAAAGCGGGGPVTPPVADEDAELTIGIHNNCVWVGTQNAAKTVGYTMA